ncbi:alpha/beta hydrolase-fold protein [Variovorax defluvii]|uniref:Alpha/beta hydrolase-fold protein n=1 Tax=Variovorax defluvii TaxID=913761 RepID=A0ABP8I8T6_9BURK
MSLTAVNTSMVQKSQYFEIDSQFVRSRLGVWVSPPPRYALSDADFPVLYATDGTYVGRITEMQAAYLMGDFERPVRPYIHVSVGYIGEEADKLLMTRNRDFVPPGEPLAPEFREFIQTRVDAGLMTQQDSDDFFHHFERASADKFLRFMQEELHPEICKRYRVDRTDVGLFGSSNGGLFSLYAFTEERTIFTRIAACSPGLLVPDSRIYARYEDLLAQKVDRSRMHLYMYLNGPEIVGPCELFRRLGIESLRFIDRVRDEPLQGLRLSTDIGCGENHYTGIIDAYKGFVRTCCPWRDAPDVMNTPASMRHMMRSAA